MDQAVKSGSFVRYTGEADHLTARTLKVYATYDLDASRAAYSFSEPCTVVMKGREAGYAKYVVKTASLVVVEAPKFF